MSLWASWFGTPTEKKREQYRALYHDLKNQLSNFNSKLRTMVERLITIWAVAQV